MRGNALEKVAWLFRLVVAIFAALVELIRMLFRRDGVTVEEIVREGVRASYRDLQLRYCVVWRLSPRTLIIHKN